jgi:hypothetical protein
MARVTAKFDASALTTVFFLVIKYARALRPAPPLSPTAICTHSDGMKKNVSYSNDDLANLKNLAENDKNYDPRDGLESYVSYSKDDLANLKKLAKNDKKYDPRDGLESVKSVKSVIQQADYDNEEHEHVRDRRVDSVLNEYLRKHIVKWNGLMTIKTLDDIEEKWSFPEDLLQFIVNWSNAADEYFKTDPIDKSNILDTEYYYDIAKYSARLIDFWDEFRVVLLGEPPEMSRWATDPNRTAIVSRRREALGNMREMRPIRWFKTSIEDLLKKASPCLPEEVHIGTYTIEERELGPLHVRDRRVSGHLIEDLEKEEKHKLGSDRRVDCYLNTYLERHIVQWHQLMEITKFDKDVTFIIKAIEKLIIDWAFKVDYYFARDPIDEDNLKDLEYHSLIETYSHGLLDLVDQFNVLFVGKAPNMSRWSPKEGDTPGQLEYKSSMRQKRETALKEMSTMPPISWFKTSIKDLLIKASRCLPEVDAEHTGGVSSTKRTKLKSWQATKRTAKCRDGTTRTLFKNPAKPGELRVRKMVLRGGRKTAVYVKP